METLFDRYKKALDKEFINQDIERIIKIAGQQMEPDNLKRILGCIDLTSLNTDDNEIKIMELCSKINEYPDRYPGFPQVAAICVFPSLVHVPKEKLNDQSVKIASVSGGFPSSQTFHEVRVLETEMAVRAGASEIDTVMPPGRFLEGDYINLAGELVSLRRSAGEAHLKVILETGLLGSIDNIRNASLLAMQAGAGFIKTSTGKIPVGATYEAVYVMADAAADFFRKTGRKVGIKPAGGVVEPEDALVYSTIVAEILGEEWLTPSLFRIGASRLVNNLLNSIMKLQGKKPGMQSYF